jgi:hypothetical protein
MTATATATHAGHAAETGLRPDLNGLLMSLPRSTTKYLIFNGYKCFVSELVYKSLFKKDATVNEDSDLDEITTGTALLDGAALVSATGTGIYLIALAPAPLSGTIVRMGIINPEIFSRYQFNPEKPVVIPLVCIQGIPEGPNVEPPSIP